MKNSRLVCCLVALSTFLTSSLIAQTGSDNAAAKEQMEQGQQALKAGKYRDAIDFLNKANSSQGNSCGECYLLMAYLVIDGDGAIKERFTGLNPQESIVHRLKATLAQMPQLEGEARK